jgi:transposase
VWFVLDVVAMVDLTEFDKRHSNDGVGRRAYDPEMMFALLFYAYCIGLRSSRRIEAAVRSDIAFKAICCDLVPDNAAIIRFRSDHEQAIQQAFIDVLSLCAKAGLVSLDTVAIDGTKIGSDAALDTNRTESAICTEVERIMSEARTADETEASQLALGGELPEVLAHRSSRLGRLRTALAEIEAANEKQRQEGEAQTNRWNDDAVQGRRPRGKRPLDPERALKRAQADVDAAAARQQ